MKKDIDVVSLGECLVDMICTTRGVALKDAPGFVKAFGGALANVAVGCTRLGAKAAFVGKVGDDPFGQYLRDFLIKDGAVVDGMVLDKNCCTCLVFVNLDESSKPSFYFFGKPAADLMLRADEVNVELIRRAKYFHFGTVSLSAEPSRSATQFAVKAAKEAGATISFDPNIRFHMWSNRDDALSWTHKMLGEADIVKVNDDEAGWLFGSRDYEAAIGKFHKIGAKLAIITLGADGLIYGLRGKIKRVPAFKANVVDTTGAGDAFVAALLTGLAKSGADDPLGDETAVYKSVRRACAAAALATEGVGAVAAMPDAASLEKALRARFDIGEDK